MKKITLSLIAVLILIVLAGLAWYGIPFIGSRLATQKAAKIISFEASRQEMVLTGENLSRVEIWAVPTGTNVTEKDYSLLGKAALSTRALAKGEDERSSSPTTTEDVQSWIFPVPEIPLQVAEIFARAFNIQNQKVGDKPLPFSSAADIYNALWGPETPETEITMWDDTRTFSYALGSTFGIKLDMNRYPQNNFSVAPTGIIGSLSNAASTSPPFYVTQYKALKPGTCTIKTGDFSVNVYVYDPAMGERQYSDSQYGFSFNFPPQDVVNPNVGYQFVTDNSLIRVDLPRNDFIDTNLGEAAFIVGANQTDKMAAQCLEMFPQTESKQDNDETINGVDYKVFEAMGVGAGNLYETKNYRTLYNNVCYEAVLLLHSGSILNYSTGTVREFSKDQALSALEEILKTFTINK
jgi:hypothetical protein